MNSAVLQYPPASPSEALAHFTRKLEFETEASDVHADMEARVPGIVVVDARSAESFAREHIPGAINLHHRLISGTTTADWDRAFTYVVYCDGIGCNASTKGALKLASLGFQVKEMLGGLEWWKYDGYETVKK